MMRVLGLLTPEEWVAPRTGSFPSIRDTVAHIYFSEWAWYSRWQGRSPRHLRDASEFQDVAALDAAWAELEADVCAYLAAVDDTDVARVIAFTFPDGRAAALPLGQMAQHVVNHASYHRGQVTTLLRQGGHALPQPMDLVVYCIKRSSVDG